MISVRKNIAVLIGLAGALAAPLAAASCPGTAILGHPLNAVLWLIADLRRSGIRLKAGDVLSLGSFSPLVPPRAGGTYTVRYLGLPGEPEVSVRFK